jgi:hypothetical protein
LRSLSAAFQSCFSNGSIVSEYKGAAFVSNIGFGYRFAENPFFVRLAYRGLFQIDPMGLNIAFTFQLGFRIK